MIKFDNDRVCVVQMASALSKIELKYGEALVQSDGLTKYSVLLLWKILETNKICPFFFSVEGSASYLSLILCFTVPQ